MTTSKPNTQSGPGGTNSTTQDMVIGIFETHSQAEEVVHRLIDAGIPADHISIVTQGLELREQIQGYITTGDVARQTAGLGAWTGGIFGLLTGAAFLWVPTLGPLIVLGPLVGAALGAAEGGVAGGLLGALLGRWVEKQRIPKYESALQGGKVLVIVHGSTEDLETVRHVMAENHGQEITTYPAAAA
ncbi:MAG TPA: general stress protein [Ktedonobacterales bacterium]|jgi:uncharacterized membrane protein|nr:general stress protein [Ktedonobacterales bacterium]